MSREQTVRDVAYAIWEAEGKPRGRDAEHWRLAEERVAASLAGGNKTDAAVKGARRAPSAKPPAKAGAAKTAGAKGAPKNASKTKT